MDFQGPSNPGPTTRPAPRRRARVALAVLAGAAVVAGCSQPGPFYRRQTMMGALKSNVAQLESEKDRLAKQLAEQKAETRRVENELAAVEDKNGELAARLDDARTLIGRQGGGNDALSENSRASAEVEVPAPRRSTPARSSPRGRRAPFAQIPTDRRDLDEPDAGDDLELPRPRARRDGRDDQSRLDDRSPWLPVAQDKKAANRKIR